MPIDYGLVIIIGAVLIFYLRLIILQRERAKRIARQVKPSGKKKGQTAGKVESVSFSLLSQNKRDWVIAGTGIVLIIIGILVNLGVIPFAWARSLWWLPVTIGIIAFSWGFR